MSFTQRLWSNLPFVGSAVYARLPGVGSSGAGAGSGFDDHGHVDHRSSSPSSINDRRLRHTGGFVDDSDLDRYELELDEKRVDSRGEQKRPFDVTTSRAHTLMRDQALSSSASFSSSISSSSVTRSGSNLEFADRLPVEVPMDVPEFSVQHDYLD